MATLILLRHGESQWNAENRFTGWTDVDLTPKGESEAARAGKAIAAAGLGFAAAYASVLKRAVRTLHIVERETGLEAPSPNTKLGGSTNATTELCRG